MWPGDEYLVCANRLPREYLGELEVFRALRDDPVCADWTVLYSVVVQDQARLDRDETDFVLLIPGRAIVALEVKGDHTPPEAQGQNWLFAGLYVHRNPYDQALDHAQTLRRFVTESDKPLGRALPWLSMVCWPYLRWDRLPSSRAERFQTIASDDMASEGIGSRVLENVRLRLEDLRGKAAHGPDGHRFGRFIEALAGNRPTRADCERVAKILRPSFALAADTQSEMRRLDLLLERLTDEQLEARETILGQERVAVTGPAGSGKTILALDRAIRHANGGRRVLFVCPSLGLERWVRAEALPRVKGGLIVSDVRSLLLTYSGLEPPELETDGFWNRTAPTAAFEHALEYEGFDEVIIDDAQTILLDHDAEDIQLVLSFLGAILRGGWRSGSWALFADEYQSSAIWDHHLDWDQWLKGLKYAVKPKRPHIGDAILLAGSSELSYAPIRLWGSHRTPPDVAGSLDRIAGVLDEWRYLADDWEQEADDDTDYRPGFEIHWLTEEDGRVAELEDTLRSLLEEGFMPGDIAVISDAHWPNLPSPVLVEDESLSALLQPMELAEGANYIRYGDVGSFQGLEAHVVVVVDVMNDCWRDESYLANGYLPASGYDRGAIMSRPGVFLQTTLYRAMTRATHRAILLLPKPLQLPLYECMNLDADEEDPPFPWWDRSTPEWTLKHVVRSDGAILLTPDAGEPMPIPVVVGPFQRGKWLIADFWDRYYPAYHVRRTIEATERIFESLDQRHADAAEPDEPDEP